MKRIALALLFAGCANSPPVAGSVRYVAPPPSRCVEAAGAILSAIAPCARPIGEVTVPQALQCAALAIVAASPCAPVVEVAQPVP